jgi:hypothetical protein
MLCVMVLYLRNKVRLNNEQRKIMDMWIVIVIAVVALGIGILIGRIPLRKLYALLSSTVSSAKTYKSRSENLQRQLGIAQGNARTAESRLEKAQEQTLIARKAAEVLHKSCPNGDQWSDHTLEHPNGLTPAVRRAIKKRDEEARIAREAQAKRDAERRAKETAEREERDAEAAKKRRSSSSNTSGYGTYDDGGAAAIAMAAAVSTTFDTPSVSCDTSSASVDCSF